MQGPILNWSMWNVAQTILANIKISTQKNTLAYYLFVNDEEEKGNARAYPRVEHVECGSDHTRKYKILDT
jgi:hypothetical protein